MLKNKIQKSFSMRKMFNLPSFPTDAPFGSYNRQYEQIYVPNTSLPPSLHHMPPLSTRQGQHISKD